jgi:hypothetical protein
MESTHPCVRWVGPLQRWALGLVLLTHASFVHAAPPSESDSVSAQVFFERGREAAAKGNQTEACEAFEESLRLELAVGTLFNLAQCEEALGKVASAWQHLHEGLDRLDANDRRRGPAQASADALERRLPWLTVTLAPGASGKVFRDGVELSPASLGTALPQNPGRHVVTVRAPGHAETRTEVTLALGERRSLTVDAGPADSQVPASSNRVPLWIATGTSAAALGVGLVTGGLALSRSNVVDGHCAGRVCDPEGTDALAAGKRFGNVSTAAFATAGVAGGLAVVLWFVYRAKTPPRTAGVLNEAGAVRF